MIYDLANNQLTTAAIDVAADGTTTLQIKIDCDLGLELRAETVPDVLVEAREIGETLWQDIEAAPLSLDPYSGRRATFAVRLTAADLAVVTEHNFKLVVGLAG